MASNLDRLTLSPTKVDTFSKCQRKFYYNFINSPFPQMEHDFFIVGNVAHKALELFHQRFLDNVPWQTTMSVSFKDAVASQNAFQKIEKGLLTLEHLYSVKQMLKNYLFHLRSGAVVNVFKLEQLAKITINKVPVGLKADRVDRTSDGGYVVIDYKTSKNPASKKDELESVQIPSYGIWIRQRLAPDATKIDGAYYYLRHIKTKRGVHEHKVTEEWMEKAANQYAHVYNLIQNGCKYIKTTERRTCQYCDYRLPCSSDFGFN
jgi:DNA helicase-2/ATP-dependent DNA helicase PcrA